MDLAFFSFWRPAMLDLILVPPAQWEIREPGVLGLVGTDHITITLGIDNMYLYTVRYRGAPVANGRHAVLADAKAAAMALPALLLNFGMEA
jgi:hypothetical protein